MLFYVLIPIPYMADLSQSSTLSEGERELTFSVTNFNQLEGARVSDKQRVDGFLWRLMVTRKDLGGSSQGGKAKVLGVYLQRVPESTTSSDVTTITRATITLVNQNNPEQSFSKEFSHSYSNSSTDWGYSSFLKLRDVTNPAKGFIANDTIVLKAKVKVLQDETSRDEKSSEVTYTSALVCPCCGSEYEPQGAKQPMSLRCGHTFCSECLDTKANTDSLSTSITCVLCKQEHSGASCHELWFPNHSVIQMIGNVIPKSKYFCEAHRQNMDYYCFEDSCLVCIVCAYQGKHVGHSCKPVSLARADMESQLQLAVKKVVSKSTELSRKLELLEDEQKALKNQEEGLVRVVEQSYRELEEIIKKQRESQLQELREHMEECNSSIEANIRMVNKKSSQVQETLASFKNWQSLSAKDALQKAVTLRSNLEATGSLAIDTRSPLGQCTTISFTRPLLDVFSAIGSQGKLELTASQRSTENGPTDSQTDVNSGNIQMPPNKRRKKMSQENVCT